MKRGVRPGRPDDPNHDNAEHPRAGAHDDPVSTVARGHASFMKTMQAHRHPGTALMGAINSVTSRHNTLGTTR